MGSLQDDIIKYKKGELGPQEMHALEKKALNDPFLAEALEGIENISSHDLHQDVEELNRRILKEKKTILFTPLRIAAGLILVSASIFILYQLAPKHETIALKTEKPTTPISSPKTEPQKEEKKKEVSESQGLTNSAPTGGEQVKPVKRKAPQVKVEKEKVNAGDQEAKKKFESQPIIAELKENAGPEKKMEEVITAPQEKADVAISVEPAMKIQQQQDLKAESIVTGRAKKAKYKSEALSGAGLPGKISVVSKPVSGKVTSAEDGSALPGVNVVVEGTTIGTVTDANGKFSLQTTDENQRLVFSFIGLKSQEVSVQGKDNVDVELKTDVTQLSEVVVTRLVVTRDDDAEPIIHLAEPEGGRRSYNKYLDSNVRYPEEALKSSVKGKVKVEFAVRTDGSLDEYKVVKSLGYGCDEEVIRLIKEGPKWSPTTKNGRPIESTVLVGVRFDPAKAGR